MKQVIILLFMFFQYSNITAQTVPYSPMAVEGAHWFYFGETSPGLPFYDYGYSLSIKGDSIYKNQKYKKIYQYYFAFDNVKKTFPYPYIIKGGAFYGLIRDDTLQRKVFYIGETFHGGCNDFFPDEFLLHDFSNINVNDTLKTCSFNGFAKAIITETESKVIYNRNRFIFTYKIPFMNASKIGEGIGFLINGGIFHIFPFEQQLWFKRYCLGTDENCNLVTASRDINENKNVLKIRNRNQIFQVNYKQINHSNIDYKLQLYNLNGQKIKELDLSNLEEIVEVDIEQEGLFFASLVQNGLLLGSTKIVID